MFNFIILTGPCDRRAAHAKFIIKRYVNEGRDVTSAIEMKKVSQKCMLLTLIYLYFDIKRTVRESR